ncbi:sigma-54-dependent Fis family transcriptional regulator [Exilibacterium tricleocarpae]|uniref:Sigma-54-dependent Fis family transcriptional regulator n=1 Tax=Exilibacterium tricleocarpae TaxID=2591008 RepID=A0A545TLW5_9GAMM|nr:sigma-54 dependent transcriptional regulator [Exilibacterium tricleocarpae]TQV78237.1 sigma-54-dependent Fis family transcriptional regulator [Exilibacterium tricleocarpae]
MNSNNIHSSAVVSDFCENMIGESLAMQKLKLMIARIAPSRKAVLITGPTGSGKELVARSLHEKSPYASGPLVSVNCSTFPESLIESLLFGHEKGAFTGADKKHNGYFSQAENGTLFLDEIGEMPLMAQAKLLRILETGRYTRVGGSTEQGFRGRIIAATHVDLKQAIQQREFREDLYFRLNVLTIETAGLSERLEDIPALITFFSERSENPMVFTEKAIGKIQQMEWPGNIRELRNAVERLCLLSDREEVTPQCVEAILQKKSMNQLEYLDRIAKMILNSDVVNKKKAIFDALLLRALKESGGNKSEAAKLLGVHRKVVERRYFAYLEEFDDPQADMA